MLVDGFTRFTLPKPSRSLRSTEAIERLRQAFGEFGYPRRLISDQGMEFTSRAFKSFVAKKGVRHICAAIATPRGTGRLSGQIARYLRLWRREQMMSPGSEKGINNTVNATTRFTPPS